MKILVAYDGSEQSQRALDALRWFSTSNPDVLIVSVLNGMALDARGEVTDPDPVDLRQAEDSLARACATVGSSSKLVARTAILVGDPKTMIVKKVIDEQVNLVITGSRGLGLAKRLVFGSVSSAILNEADCAVMVVK